MGWLFTVFRCPPVFLVFFLIYFFQHPGVLAPKQHVGQGWLLQSDGLGWEWEEYEECPGVKFQTGNLGARSLECDIKKIGKLEKKRTKWSIHSFHSQSNLFMTGARIPPRCPGQKGRACRCFRCERCGEVCYFYEDIAGTSKRLIFRSHEPVLKADWHGAPGWKWNSEPATDCKRCHDASFGEAAHGVALLGFVGLVVLNCESNPAGQVWIWHALWATCLGWRCMKGCMSTICQLSTAKAEDTAFCHLYSLQWLMFYILLPMTWLVAGFLITPKLVPWFCSFKTIWTPNLAAALLMISG